MQRRYEKFYSTATGRDMELLTFGHFGPPMIVFPDMSERFFDFENHGMTEALNPLLEAGRLKLYCVDRLDESWLVNDINAEQIAIKHLIYQCYIVKDLLPAIYMDCKGTVPIGLLGYSQGAYHAANFALKYPHLFHYALCLSGRYNLEAMTGIRSKDIYFNNPFAYVGNLHGETLEQIQHRTHLVLVCGQGIFEDICLAETQQLAQLLKEKHISHELDIWGHDVDHHWYWWRKQLVHHLNKSLG